MNKNRINSRLIEENSDRQLSRKNINESIYLKKNKAKAE